MSTPYEQEVILDADGQPIFAALKQVRAQIDEINAAVAKVAAQANKGVADYGNILRNTAKELQQSLSQIRSIAQAKNSPGLMIQDLNANQRLAKATTQATEYARGIEAASTAAEALRAKLNQVNREIAARGAANQAETLQQTKIRKGLEDQLRLLKEIEAQERAMERRATRTNIPRGDVNRANTMAQSVSNSRQSLNQTIRNGGDTTAALLNYRAALDAFDDYIKAVRTRQASRIADERAAGRAAEAAEIKLQQTRTKVHDQAKKQMDDEASAARRKAKQIQDAWAAQEKAAKWTAGKLNEAEREKKKYLDDTSASIEKQRQQRYKLTEEEKQGMAVVARQNAALNVIPGVGNAASSRTLFQGQMAAASGEVRNAVLSGQTSASTALLGARFEQQLRQNELQKALLRGESEQIKLATQNLQIADAKVRAAERLTKEEERQIDLQRRLNAGSSGESQRGQVALAAQYAREQIRTLGAAEAIKRAKQDTLVAEQRLTEAVRRGTAEQIQQARAALALQQTRERAVTQQGSGPVGAILSGRYALAAFARTSVYGAAAAAAYGLFNTIQTGLVNVIQLEDELAKLSAIADATSSQMTMLKGSIFDVAASSRFATVDLVKISQTLAQAGVNVNEMTDVLRSVTTLANASGSTPDEAVNLVTSALGAFQLQASEAARVADLMTSALNRTKLTVAQTGQAIQYVGSTAYEQNISLEQLLATVGAVAQAGVRSGSTIGTGFRQFLVDLQSPSEKLTATLKSLGLTQADVNVETRGLGAVLETLKNAGFGSAQAYESLEVRAAAFYLTAKNNIDIMDQLQLAFQDQSAAARANERAMDSLSAQWQRFKNIVGDGFAQLVDKDLQEFKGLLKSLNDSLESFGTEMDNVKARWNAGWNNYEKLAGGNQLVAAYYYWTDRFYVVAGNMDEAKDKSEDLATSISNTSDKIATQTGMLSEIQNEYVRLVTQKDSLINNDQRSAAEMSNLMNRFEGLSLYLTNTKNLYVDLTNAVRGFIAANNEALAGQISEQQKNLAQQSENLRSSRGTLANDVRRDPGFAKLDPRVQAAVNDIFRYGAGSDQFRRGIPLINDAARSAGVINTPLGKKLSDLGSNMTQGQSNNSTQRMLTTQRNNADAASTEEGSRISSNIAQVEAYIAKGKKTEALAIIRDTRNYMGSINPKPQHRTFMADALSSLDSLQNQATAAPLDTKKTKAEQAPLVSQKDLDSVITGMGLRLGRGNDTSAAARARQNAMHARGQTPATADTSAHTRVGGVARDIPMSGRSMEEMKRAATALEVKLKEAGIDATVLVETGKGKNQGTGQHLHVQVRRGARMRGSRGEASPQNAIDRFLDEKQLQIEQKNLETALDEMAKSTTSDTFQTAAAAAKEALDRVNETVRNKAMNELAGKGLMPGDAEWEVRMGQVEKEIAQNTAEYQSKVAGAIVKNLDNMFKAAEQAFQEAIAPAVAAKAMADAQVSGLGYASNDGKVPDYVRTLAERRAANAAENLDRQRSAALPSEIAMQEQALQQAQAKMSTLEFGSADYEAATAKIREMTKALQDLRTEKATLDAALNASSQIPRTLTEGLKQAIEAYKETHDLNRTFQDDLIMNFGGVLDNAHQSMSTFFSDVLTGTKSISAAFGDMVNSIINYLGQLVAQWLANQVFGLILNAIGLGMGGGFGGGGLGSAGSSVLGLGASIPFGNAWWGGKAEPQGYLGGGKVSNGSTAMDSVNAKLARGEWVVNRRAVDSVGDGFMAQLNAHGSKAIDSLRGVPQIIQAPEQRTNVYVVAPDQKPSLSKNDVLVTMQEDMLNGESRKLIKSISQGG
jgi:TP901 family phage tail tape measure protein